MVLGTYSTNITPYRGSDMYVNEYNSLASQIDSAETMEDCYAIGTVLRDFIKRYGPENVQPLSETLYEQTYNIFTK